MIHWCVLQPHAANLNANFHDHFSFLNLWLSIVHRVIKYSGKHLSRHQWHDGPHFWYQCILYSYNFLLTHRQICLLRMKIHIMSINTTLPCIVKTGQTWRTWLVILSFKPQNTPENCLCCFWDCVSLSIEHCNWWKFVLYSSIPIWMCGYL